MKQKGFGWKNEYDGTDFPSGLHDSDWEIAYD